MLELIPIVLTMLAVGLWLHGRVAYYTKDNSSLRSVQFILNLCVMFWGVILLGKVIAVYCNGLSGDAIYHEDCGRYVAALLTEGRWLEVVDSFGFGNTGYHFLLGIFYAISSASPEIVIVINGALGCAGVLGLLDALARNATCDRVPGWLVICICALPSTVFWTTTHLKEGIMLWAICGVIRGGLLIGNRTVPRTKRSFVIHALAGLWFRPHIAVIWIVAMGFGVVILRRKYHLLPFLGVGVTIAFSGLSMFASDLMQGVENEGVNQTLAANYQDKIDHYEKIMARGDQGGGSVIRYAGGKPVLVFSGLMLLFLRPYPTEVFNVASLLSGFEVWILSLILFCVWWRTRHRFRLLFTPAGVAGVIGILLFSVFLSYCYNMGLVVRQRLQAFPGIFLLISLPVLSPAPVSLNSSEEGTLQTHLPRSRVLHRPIPRARLPLRTSVLQSTASKHFLSSRAVTYDHPPPRRASDLRK